MKLKFAVYNMQWMVNLFTRDGVPKTSGDDGKRSGQLAEVVKAVDPDILGVVEGPDTTVSGSKLASKQLEAWAALHGLHGLYRGVHGFPSPGRQELCALYRSDKVTLKHAPVRSMKKDPFNEPFLVDTTESLIQEQYEHYRPPFEISVRTASGGDEVARCIIAHAKSKGIFDAVDMARFQQVSERNRKKLFAECLSIRNRCDQWMEDYPNLPVIVMGDINDGFGMDYYERRFCRSAIDTLLGDVWFPDKILKHILPQPKLGRYGWTPSSSRFQDRLTGDKFNVLIDHILVSRKVTVSGAMVWNPFINQETEEQTAQVKAIKESLLEASDHFPVSALLSL